MRVLTLITALFVAAPAVAQALGVPHVVAEAVPVLTPTRQFPAPGVVNRDLGRFNQATYAVARGAERMFRRDIDRACAQLPGGRPATRQASQASQVADGKEGHRFDVLTVDTGLAVLSAELIG